ncbi:hypothetical protein VTN00DRAFT_6726 [Thermoascus crustaceus]|uniref:uncharacterized protein n=1 Tax=Thermoascus crustaceus TaxID=5088 RepID=UPI003744597F
MQGKEAKVVILDWLLSPAVKMLDQMLLSPVMLKEVRKYAIFQGPVRSAPRIHYRLRNNKATRIQMQETAEMVD